MQGTRAVRRDLKLLQRHASRFAEDVNRLGSHLVEAGTEAAHGITGQARWRDLPRTSTENLRQLAAQTKKQLDILSEQTKRQVRAMDKQVHDKPYPFVTGSFFTGIAAGALLGFFFRRK